MALNDGAEFHGETRASDDTIGSAPAARPPAPAPDTARRGRGRGLVVLLMLAALAGAAWYWRAPLLRAVGYGMAQNGDGQGSAKDPAGEADKGGEDGASNTVTLDAAGQKRIGLAFGTAETRPIVLPVRVPGTVAFDERRVTHLKPRTQGRVLSLAVQPGDRVSAGQTLATLDAAGILDARNGLASAEASLGEARASEAAAALQLKRGLEQLSFGGVAKAEVEKRQVDLAKAQAAVKSAEANAATFRAQVERLAPAEGANPGTSAIVTPIAGVVTSVGVTLGEVVDTGRDAFTVADPSRMLVLANLYSPDIARVKAGDGAEVEAPIPGHAAFTGRVGAINAALDPATNTAPARIEIANPDDLLRANMFVSVTIAANLGRTGVTIPAASVQQTEQGPIAFKRTGTDTFERQALTLGIQRTDWVEVKEGIAVGDTVATQGSFGLKAILLRSLLGSTD
ncbi:efflux RND transporter periplasmic adaptor subunit [Methylobacterium aerolatum]|uniref:Cobalt-zinc-cadmium efflux system membrane fusion protein n=1 Tax=Methylobacterium aerolatum TaxID=418708 RepID=A0ABU0HW24_9HYPH|nr:efflux RND transporter periplasmic adaptor subunit [Methylobacterium aerolatum]MDQ0446540.1 cobalt-zinc-cadmium efflux system membrane fusion protein [Methylobacterium aerolatum]GJD33299.1 Multidrug resistance protein MdtA [Methylobacterium aerolatum]